MGKATSREEVRVLKKRDYVRVIDTLDEWEGLIGRIEEFSAPDCTTHDVYAEGDKIIVFFPYLKDDVRTAKLVGVNVFPGLVMVHLRQYEGKQLFEPSLLEWVDPEEL